ncbi:MAG: hypothetical protein IH926_06865 [Proteobacteria bacterium]|nr:hypothetical protein [Pseudomonadota bacterium]
MGKTRQGSLLLGSAFNVGLLAWLAGAMTASVAAEGRAARRTDERRVSRLKYRKTIERMGEDG